MSAADEAAVESAVFKCECGWEGPEREMGSDWVPADEGDELRSNHICPGCGTWWVSMEDSLP